MSPVQSVTDVPVHSPPRAPFATAPCAPPHPADLAACNALSVAVHGFDRSADLAQSIAQGTALVTERDGRITAYATILGFFGHATAETTPDLCALIASADTFAGPGILVPTRNCCALPLVSRQRPPRRPAHEPHEPRPLQRARRSLPSLHPLLNFASCRTAVASNDSGHTP